MNTEKVDNDRLRKLLAFREADPDDSFTNFAIAAEYRKMGKLDEARAYFEALVSETPNYVGTYFHLGKLYEEIDLVDLAKRTYSTGIEVASRLRDSHSKAELQSALLELEMDELE